MSRKFYWIFVLFCGIILFEMTGCSNKIEILSFESNPAKFSPDGDGVDETTTISCKTRSTVLEGVFSSQDELIVKYNFTIVDDGVGIYGITNIKDYQEQVDMIEAGIASIMGNQDLLGGKKLKGIIIFSDSLAESPEDLDWQFPTKRKPSDKYLNLIGR